MSVLYIALPIALLLGLSAMIACVACLRSGQFDDLETPALRILVDETSKRHLSTNRSKEPK